MTAASSLKATQKGDFLALAARTHAGHDGTRAFLLPEPHKVK